MKIGILDLQGAVAPHREKLAALGIDSVGVKKPEHLKDLSGIILPGGESTAMIHLLKLNSLWDELKIFVRQKPAWGICAGVILLAEKVLSPQQESFGAMHITVERNAYGRQVDSFIDTTTATEHWEDSTPVEGVFIRAPIIQSRGKNVRTLLTHGGHHVLVQENNKLGATFHPELSLASKVHEYFIKICEG